MNDNFWQGEVRNVVKKDMRSVQLFVDKHKLGNATVLASAVHLLSETPPYACKIRGNPPFYISSPTRKATHIAAPILIV
jgi:hypothetical protein